MPSQNPEGQKSAVSRFCSRPSELLSSVAGAANTALKGSLSFSPHLEVTSAVL